MHMEIKTCVVGSNKVKVIPKNWHEMSCFNHKMTPTRVSAVLGAIVALAMLEESRNLKKSPLDCLSSAAGVHSWESSTEQEKNTNLQKSTVNDDSESNFGGCKQWIQSHSGISLTSKRAWNKHAEHFQEESKDVLINERQTNKLAVFMSCQKR